MKKNTSQRGFTLIELLVVIAIIASLSSIVLASLNTARAKSRDVARAATMRQIASALEIYYSDNNQYPITNCSGGLLMASFDSGNIWVNNPICTTVGGPTVFASISAALNPYIKGVADPRFTNNQSGYLYRSNDGINYKIVNFSSPENMNNYPASMIDTARCSLPISPAGLCNSGAAAAGFWTPGGISF